MTFRETLYNTLPSWFAHITAANGYTNTLRAGYKGIIPASANSQDLTYWYFLGEEKPVLQSEDTENVFMEMSLYFGISIRSENKEGALIAKYESLLSDIYKWLFKGSGITANNWFAPSAELTGTLGYLDSAQLTQVQPAMSFKENVGEIYIELKVRYQLEP